MHRFKLAIALLALGLLPLAGTAAGAPMAVVSSAWIRWLPGKLPMAGYFTLKNTGAHELVLTGASSEAYAGVMMHQSVDAGGAETMRHVERLEIGPGKQIEFAPGGYHLMLMHRLHAIKVGDTVPIALHFANGQTLDVTFIVKGAAG